MHFREALSFLNLYNVWCTIAYLKFLPDSTMIEDPVAFWIESIGPDAFLACVREDDKTDAKHDDQVGRNTYFKNYLLCAISSS